MTDDDGDNNWNLSMMLIAVWALLNDDVGDDDDDDDCAAYCKTQLEIIRWSDYVGPSACNYTLLRPPKKHSSTS